MGRGARTRCLHQRPQEPRLSPEAHGYERGREAASHEEVLGQDPTAGELPGTVEASQAVAATCSAEQEEKEQ